MSIKGCENGGRERESKSDLLALIGGWLAIANSLFQDRKISNRRMSSRCKSRWSWAQSAATGQEEKIEERFYSCVMERSASVQREEKGMAEFRDKKGVSMCASLCYAMRGIC